MKIRLWLSIRILLLVVISTGTIFYIALQIIGQSYRKSAFRETMLVNDNYATKYASIIKSSLEKDFDIIRTYGEIAQNIKIEDYPTRRGYLNEILIDIAKKKPTYTAVWDTWELRFINKKYELPYGRVSHSFYRDALGEIELKTDTLDLDGDNAESLYYMYKLVPEEAITDPYKYSYTGLKKDEILETSLIAPMLVNNEFAGLTGIDLSLEHFQHIIDSLNKEQGYRILFFSFNGDIIAHPKKELIGTNIVIADTFLTSRYSILDRIQSGKNSNFIIKDADGNDSSYFSMASITIGKTQTPWAILIEAPLQEIDAQVTHSLSILNKVSYIGLMILIIITFAFSIFLVLPLQKTRKILNKLSKGEVLGIAKLRNKSNDEIGEMAESVNTVIDGMNKVTEFADHIGKGNYDFEFKQLGKKDFLGNAIIEMRNSLKKAKDEESNRREEEKQLEWASQGINIFNKVLRVDNQNLEVLTYEIVKTLTLYLEDHMGGIYLKDVTNDSELELISYLGFSKEKYNKKYIRFGDDLVGRCALEKETIFMNDIPNDFTLVTSGLGRSIPASVLVVPLISNQELIGVLEIESLKEIKKYQINFVERIAENIASTVATVKTNVRTAQLLSKAKKQAEELEQQEEEIRQTMEEMQATQEEARKREEELNALIKGYGLLMPILEFDLKGRIIEANDNYLKIYKARKSQLIGKQHKADLFMNDTELQKHQAFWENLANGKEQEQIEYIKSGKEDYWLLEKFLPVQDRFGIIQKVICIGIDITDQKKTESKIKQIQEGVLNAQTGEKIEIKKKSSPVIDLNQELTIVDLTYLKMVYKKDSQKIYNILKLYYETLPSQLEEIFQLAKARDYVKLKSKINSLKTKMSYLGLKQIYDNLRNIEKLLAEQKNLNEITGMLKSISKYWSLAYSELKKVLRVPN